jgi:hypothetical protein
MVEEPFASAYNLCDTIGSTTEPIITISIHGDGRRRTDHVEWYFRLY